MLESVTDEMVALFKLDVTVEVMVGGASGAAAAGEHEVTVTTDAGL